MRPNEHIPSKIQLQKIIFLLEREYLPLKLKNPYEFITLYYGSFLKEVAVELNAR